MYGFDQMPRHRTNECIREAFEFTVLRFGKLEQPVAFPAGLTFIADKPNGECRLKGFLPMNELKAKMPYSIMVKPAGANLSSESCF